MLALASPEAIDITGITTVAGNVIEDLTRNARGLLALARRYDTPIHRDVRDRSCRRRDRAAVHGEGGLGGVSLDLDSVPLGDADGVDFIIETVMRRPGEITLCPIGPMTNVRLR